MVEAACYTTTHPRKNRDCQLLKDVEKQAALLHSVTAPENGEIYDVLLEDFLAVPSHRFSYRISSALLDVLKNEPPLEGSYGFARRGLYC